MNDQSPQRILVISDGSVAYQAPVNVEAITLSYNFTDVSPADYFSASWQNESTLAVAETCRGLAGGFRQQALNRLITQYLLKNSVQGIVIVGLYGCTLDLPRIFDLFKLPVVWLIQATAFSLLQDRDGAIDATLQDALKKVVAINDECGALADFCKSAGSAPLSQVNAALQKAMAECQPSEAGESRYDYSLYEFSLRDHPLLCLIQQPDVAHFKGCQQVLDLGCGAGIFLSLLQEAGISAKGVERNVDIADYGRGMGLNIVTADALQFLAKTEEHFDGIYCSHFVEHLPIELVQQLLTNLARVTSDNGVVVLAFPDPESIRSQLLGFWRDPEHVRFYHPELILSLAQAVGLDAEWTSYEDQPHKLVSFTTEPPATAELLAIPAFPERSVACRIGWLEKLLDHLGFASGKRLTQIETQFSQWREHLFLQQQVIARQQQVIEQLIQRTEQLWAVNNTWAWNDNVVLKLRRRKRCP